jgi:predicted metal-dependent hydrolase
VPLGFDRREIPELLRRKERWIIRVGREFDEQRRLLDPWPRDRLPEKIELRAIGETWIVEPAPADDARVSICELRDGRLRVSGSVEDPDAWRPVLRQWVAHKARLHLAAWTESEASAHRLRCGSISIRWQKGRWGSCSRRRQRARGPAPADVGFSLNAALLFLPAHLVRYVLLHELCHAERMDHSPVFWKKLEAMEPSARVLREELRSAWQYAPSWLDGASPPRQGAERLHREAPARVQAAMAEGVPRGAVDGREERT